MQQPHFVKNLSQLLQKQEESLEGMTFQFRYLMDELKKNVSKDFFSIGGRVVNKGLTLKCSVGILLSSKSV